MMIEVPILIQPRVDVADRTSLYTVRPLCFDQPEHTDRTLSKAVSRLGDSLRQQLRTLGRSGDQASLAAYAFSPAVSLEWLELRLALRRGMFRSRFALAVFPHGGRKIAFTPHLLDVWFDIPEGESVADRLSGNGRIGCWRSCATSASSGTCWCSTTCWDSIRRGSLRNRTCLRRRS
jgi:hypothetical protein